MLKKGTTSKPSNMYPLTSSCIELMQTDFLSTSPLKIFHVQVDTENPPLDQIHPSRAANQDTTLHFRDRILINKVTMLMPDGFHHSPKSIKRIRSMGL